MIKNERQFRKLQRSLSRLEYRKSSLQSRARFQDSELISEQVQEMDRQIAECQLQLRNYWLMQAGRLPRPPLEQIQSIGQWLIEGRLAAELSQAQLATKLAFSRQQMQRYENTGYRTASLATIQLLADILLAQISLAEKERRLLERRRQTRA